MSLHAYINFKGNAKQAMEFYAKVLETDAPDFMVYSDMPDDPNFPVTEENKDWVMHGSINYDGQLIMFSDVPPIAGLSVGNHMSLLIDLEDDQKLKSLYDQLSDGGKITMPFGKTFWSKGYGACIDKFGIEWQFNCSGE